MNLRFTLTAPSSGEPPDVAGIQAETIAPARRTRHRWLWVTLVLAAFMLAWAGRGILLAGMGRLLVAEDPLEPVEMIVVSDADPLAGALEAGRLYQAGISRQIGLLAAEPDPVDDQIRALGIPRLEPTGMLRWILDRSGVPASAMQDLPGTVDGTETEIGVVAAFAREHKPSSLLFLTARTHSARARRLLRRQLPAETRVNVRSPRTDTFAADSWWSSREQSREVLIEYLHWLNTFVLGDLWGKGAAHEGA